MGFNLPRSAMATWVARRPSVLPSASTSSQRRVTSLSRAEYVFIQFLRGWPKGRGDPREARVRERVARARAAMLRPREGHGARKQALEVTLGLPRLSNPSCLRRLPELRQELPQPRQRQADDVEVVALDPLHELACQALDAVAA